MSRGVSAGCGDKVVVSDNDVAFGGLGVWVVTGPNSFGKSSLLRIVAGVLWPIKGDTFIDGVSVFGKPDVKKGIGYLSADLGLLPKLELYENIMLFLDLLGFDKRYT